MKQKAPFETPNVAVDTVLFTIIDDQLHVLMIQIGSDMYKDYWALPGGLVRLDETLDQAAVRVLFEKANRQNVYLEQLHAFGALERDPRSRTISIAYYALINLTGNEKLHENEYYKNIQWMPMNALPSQIAFDHKEIIAFAHKRLQSALSNPQTVAPLLPKRFTLTQLQRIHEVILNDVLDKRNFRKRLLVLNLVKKTKEKVGGMAHRPASLYEFVS